MADTRCRWWDDEEFGTLNDRVWETVVSISNNQDFRRRRMVELYGMYYANRPATDLKIGEYDHAKGNDLIFSSIGKNLVDTVHAKLTAEEVKPFFLTDNGDYKLQRQAKLLGQFSVGLAQKINLYRHLSVAKRDALVFGYGFVRRYQGDDGIPRVERLLPSEVYIDDEEAKYDSPRCMYLVKELAREQIRSLYPKIEETTVEGGRLLHSDNVFLAGKDLVSVVEAWHLPSGPRAKDGRHVLITSAGILVDEDYKKPVFPVHRYLWEGDSPIIGYYGLGLLEEVKDKINEENAIAQKEQEMASLASIVVLVQNGSKINTERLSNANGLVIKYDGQKPDWMNTAAMSPAIAQYRAQLKASIFEDVGVSRLDAQAMKPAGLESGESLRQYASISSEKLRPTIKAWERVDMEVFEGLVDDARELSKQRGNSVKVMAIDPRTGMKLIDWEDVDMDKDMYQMVKWPSSLFPATPSGKLARIQELAATQVLTPVEALALMDHPDLDEVTTRKLAPYREIQRAIYAMVEEDSPEYPEEGFTDIQLAGQMVRDTYLACKNAGAPESTLRLLQAYLEDCAAIATKMQPPAPPQGPPMEPAGQTPPVPVPMPNPAQGLPQ